MNYIKNGYENRFDELTSLLDSFIERGVPGNDCAVYHKGELVYRRMAGYSDFESKTPVKGDEFYNIYSCSKPITCVAAMQLWEQGKFDLDDPLYKYMPEFEHMMVRSGDTVEPATKHITIRQLFTMSAGFNYNTTSDSLMLAKAETDGRCPTRETVAYIAKESLEFEPGTSWMYSLCHDVLAGLIEVVSGMKLGEYVKKNIFDPLGMTKTTYNYPEDKFHSVASQYTLNAETKTLTNCGKQTQVYKFGTEYESGGAGVVTCMEDYVKFIEAMRIGDIILKKETIDLMSTNQLDDNLMKVYQDTPGREPYGYGLGVRCPRNEDSPQDFGWGGAAGAYVAIDRELDYTLFYLQHVFSSPVPDTGEKISIGLCCRKGFMK